MTSAVACMFQEQYGNQNLNDALKGLIGIDDKVTEEERKKMLETLTTCNTNAAGDNTKLLSCLNIFSPPFDLLIASIRVVQSSVNGCFPKCQITISEMYKMNENNIKVHKLLKIANVGRLGCFLACVFDEDIKKKPDSPSFAKTLADRINKGEVHDENQKKEMWETLSNCNAQVPEVKNRTYEIIKCIDLFKSLFIDLQ